MKIKRSRIKRQFTVLHDCLCYCKTLYFSHGLIFDIDITLDIFTRLYLCEYSFLVFNTGEDFIFAALTLQNLIQKNRHELTTFILDHIDDACFRKLSEPEKKSGENAEMEDGQVTDSDPSSEAIACIRRCSIP